jgi:hypothetical protein
VAISWSNGIRSSLNRQEKILVEVMLVLSDAYNVPRTSFEHVWYVSDLRVSERFLERIKKILR